MFSTLCVQVSPLHDNVKKCWWIHNIYLHQFLVGIIILIQLWKLDLDNTF